jgi:hypothetical protein
VQDGVSGLFDGDKNAVNSDTAAKAQISALHEKPRPVWIHHWPSDAPNSPKWNRHQVLDRCLWVIKVALFSVILTLHHHAKSL